MKKYIAVHGTNTSGKPESMLKCLDWAKKQIATHHGIASVYICEVQEVVSRNHPPVKVEAFQPEQNASEHEQAA
jgi:hypothetical protein